MYVVMIPLKSLKKFFYNKALLNINVDLCKKHKECRIFLSTFLMLIYALDVKNLFHGVRFFHVIMNVIAFCYVHLNFINTGLCKCKL